MRQKAGWLAAVVLMAGATLANADVYSGGGGPLIDGPDATGNNFNEAAFTINIAGQGGVVTSINSVE